MTVSRVCRLAKATHKNDIQKEEEYIQKQLAVMEYITDTIQILHRWHLKNHEKLQIARGLSHIKRRINFWLTEISRRQNNDWGELLRVVEETKH